MKNYYLFFLLLPVLGFAKMAYRPMFEVNSLDVKNYLEGVVKTRPLTENENQVLNLSLVANELKVDKYLSTNQDPRYMQPANITLSMTKKMQENPKWNVTQSMTNINGHLELLKNTFGAQSYGWAWFLKQRGENAEAKKVLLSVYEDGYKHIMGMSELHFGGSSPLADIQFVHQALAPMLNTQENELLESKMQRMKNHFSNLPASNIKT